VKRASRSEPRASRLGRGFSLIDVLLVIVLLGIVAGGVMTLSGRLAIQSAEAARTRQALALAQALLAEVSHMPFTYCDPNDPAAVSAPNAGACATPDLMGPEPGETRYNAANRFDGVTDYHNFAMPGPGCAGLCDITGAPIGVAGSSSLAGCDARVTLTPQALNVAPPPASVPAADALLIRVTAGCPGMQPLVLEGMRVRYAPNWF
jgi:MSHA pilin protein MshD